MHYIMHQKTSIYSRKQLYIRDYFRDNRGFDCSSLSNLTFAIQPEQHDRQLRLIQAACCFSKWKLQPWSSTTVEQEPRRRFEQSMRDPRMLHSPTSYCRA